MCYIAGVMRTLIKMKDRSKLLGFMDKDVAGSTVFPQVYLIFMCVLLKAMLRRALCDEKRGQFIL